MLKIKKLSKISLLICLCLTTFLSFAGANPQKAGIVTFIIGDVFVSHDKTAWINADFDMKIHQGDQIRTEAESRCEITLEDGTIVRMDENSFQQFEKCITSKTGKEVSLFLSTGKMWLNARKILAKSDSFKVRTNKAVCAIRGTKFRVDTDDDQTRISVHKGVVATWSSLFEKPKPEPDASILKPVPIAGPHPVSMEKWVEIVKAFQQITIDSNGKYEKKDFNINSIMEDQWIRWNMTRDRLRN
ncbi:MAG: FecR domain-containing protein [Deltaproteobacteria bacterium]|nr:FecR domain-containing protein [Deltaproteobacteria bacterium]